MSYIYFKFHIEIKVTNPKAKYCAHLLGREALGEKFKNVNVLWPTRILFVGNKSEMHGK